jgi:hypothetical protein
MVQDPKLAEAGKNYGDCIIRAAAGIGLDDPAVQEFLQCRRAFGEREYLRRARRGLEKGVSAPYTDAEMKILKLREHGKSWEYIRRQEFPRASRQSFHGWITRQGLWALAGSGL